MTEISCFFTAAGLAGWVTSETVVGPCVMVVGLRAALQATSPLPQVDIVLPTTQAVSASTTPTLATRGVTALTNPGGGVAEVTLRREGICLVSDVPP